MPATGRQGDECGSAYPVQVTLLLGPEQEWTRDEKKTSQQRRCIVAMSSGVDGGLSLAAIKRWKASVADWLKISVSWSDSRGR